MRPRGVDGDQKHTSTKTHQKVDREDCFLGAKSVSFEYIKLPTKYTEYTQDVKREINYFLQSHPPTPPVSTTRPSREIRTGTSVSFQRA